MCVHIHVYIYYTYIYIYITYDLPAIYMYIYILHDIHILHMTCLPAIMLSRTPESLGDGSSLRPHTLVAEGLIHE